VIKGVIPRKRTRFGISFPTKDATISEYLEPVADGIFAVRESERAVVTRSGVVRVGWNFLEIDYGPFSAFTLQNVRPTRRPIASYDTAVVLWSHYWSTFYHWLIDIAPKLSAAKLYFGDDVRKVKFLYPGNLQEHEAETVRHLGLFPDQIVNLGLTGGVVAERLFVLPLPGFYKIPPRVDTLRSALGLAVAPTERKPIYVSRGGRRRVVNEEQLIGTLRPYDFTIVADTPRSISEQISLFASASQIIAPHGAALSNIIWAQRDTKVLELANSSYAPPHFENLSRYLDLPYHQLTFGATPNHWGNGDQNISVDCARVDEFLRNVWQL
jgi:hypothetical protein